MTQLSPQNAIYELADDEAVSAGPSSFPSNDIEAQLKRPQTGQGLEINGQTLP